MTRVGQAILALSALALLAACDDAPRQQQEQQYGASGQPPTPPEAVDARQQPQTGSGGPIPATKPGATGDAPD